MRYDADGVVVSTYGVFVRSAYNYDKDAASRDSGLACEDATRTQQQFKDECDINVIVDRFGLTGELPENLRVPVNAEFTEILDYQTALNRLIEADEAFMQMPAKIREEFGNDAGKFVAFVSDEKNVDKCREWGLANAPKSASEPMYVRIAPEPSSGEEKAS